MRTKCPSQGTPRQCNRNPRQPRRDSHSCEAGVSTMFFGCGCCTSATNEQEASFRGPMMPEDGETLGDIESPKLQRYEPGATKQVSVPELSPEQLCCSAAFSPSKQATTVTFAGESVQEVSLPLAGRKTDLKSRKATGALRPQDQSPREMQSRQPDMMLSLVAELTAPGGSKNAKGGTFRSKGRGKGMVLMKGKVQPTRHTDRSCWRIADTFVEGEGLSEPLMVIPKWNYLGAYG
ncbi:hypothetical protein AK812_SmicGene11500 [Symbiodinium microadriaticum]|uniref:Uncharacterized protein n=1 Tax=Symbiodinium microadriaticum TaxID=2951 RepID=A0A1Q9ED53_SYMMI|nr:hypothetical protein AK812_SmicGene11500 [Symbiodinium microadriaticum]